MGCPDVRPVNLDAFAVLPDPETLPEASKKNKDAQSLYMEVAFWNRVDKDFGNNDRQLEEGEIDKFLKEHPIDDPQINSCNILNTARKFAGEAPEIARALKKGPDLSDVDLTPLYSLPELQKFVDLNIPEIVVTQKFKTQEDLDKFLEEAIASQGEKTKALIKESTISPKLKDLLLQQPTTLMNYVMARNVIKMDGNGDKKLTVSDITTLLTSKSRAIDNPDFNPTIALKQARGAVLQSALAGFPLRKSLGLQKQGDFIDSQYIFLLGGIAPEFVEGNPKLKLLRDLVAKKNGEGKWDLTDAAKDGVITKEEFIQNPLVKTFSEVTYNQSPDLLYTTVKELEETLQSPLYVWPKELRAKLTATGKDKVGLVMSAQNLGPDERRAELVLNFLEATSQSKFEQEKANHKSDSGSFVTGFLYVVSLGNFHYKKHFEDDRPNEHRKERDDAIDVLKKTLREKRLAKVEDAIEYMQKNGLSSQVEVLRSECDLNRWLETANAGKPQSDALEAFNLGMSVSPGAANIDEVYTLMESKGQSAIVTKLKDQIKIDPEKMEAGIIEWESKEPEAIQAFMNALSDLKLNKTYTFMIQNGQEKEVTILRDELKIDPNDLMGSMDKAFRDVDNKRNDLLVNAKTHYRLGARDSFWDAELLPTPRLGSGGFWNRALSLDNWTWGRNPQYPLTITIDNYLSAGEMTPNNVNMMDHGGYVVLTSQLKSSDDNNEQKTLKDIFEKAAKGEAVDLKAAEEFLKKTELTAAGQEALLNQIKMAVTAGQNDKVMEEIKKIPGVAEFNKDQEKNKDQLGRIQGAIENVVTGLITSEKLIKSGELTMIGLPEKDLETFKEELKKLQPNMPPKEPSALPSHKDLSNIGVLFQEAQLGDKLPRALELFRKSSQTDEERKEFAQIVKGGKLSSVNRTLLLRSYDLQPTTIQYSIPAAEEFLAIAGFPVFMTPDKVNPRFQGNLHTSLLTTAERGVGFGMLAGPTIAGGGLGLTLAKSSPSWVAVGKTGLKLPPIPALGGAAFGGTIGYVWTDKDASAGVHFRNTMIGAGIGGVSAYGFSKLFKVKGINPWWGAGAMALGANMYYITDSGQDWAKKSYEVMKTPYNNWSDYAMRDMWSEGMGLYADIYFGTKGMNGALDGAKALGQMEIMGSLAKLTKEGTLLNKILLKNKFWEYAWTAAFGAGMGAVNGYAFSDPKSGNQGRNTAIGAGVGALTFMGLKWNKVATLTAGGAIGGGYIGYNSADHKNTSQTIGYTAVGAMAGGLFMFLIAKGADVAMKERITPAKPDAEGWISPWAKTKHENLMKEMAPKEAWWGEQRVQKLRQIAGEEKALEKLAEGEKLTAKATGEEMQAYFNLEDEKAVLQALGRDTTAHTARMDEILKTTGLSTSDAQYIRLRTTAIAYEKLGMAKDPIMATHIMKKAQEVEARIAEIETGVASGAATEEAAYETIVNLKRAQNAIILKGSVEMATFARMQQSNQKLAKFLLTGMIATEVDKSTKPDTITVPNPVPNFQGRPKPPAAAGGF